MRLAWAALALLCMALPARGATFAELQAALARPSKDATLHNPQLRLWALVKAGVGADTSRPFRDILVPDAATKPTAAGARYASTVLYPAEAMRQDVLYWSIVRRLAQRLGQATPGVAACGDAACCPDTPTAECLAAWRIDGDDPIAALGKLQWLATAGDLIALELKPATKLMSLGEIRSAGVEGDRLLLVWNHEPAQGRDWVMVTALDAALLETLAADTARLLPNARALAWRPAAGGAYLCGPDGFSERGAFKAAGTVSRGQPNRRRTAGAAGVVGYPAAGAAGGLAFGAVERGGLAPLAGPAWDTLFAGLRAQGGLRSCLGDEAYAQLEAQPGLAVQMRNPEASSFLFSLLYLAAAWSELGQIGPAIGQ
ncbi:MAG: hypothetical protein ABW360_11605 [Phenylobacterium sp.]